MPNMISFISYVFITTFTPGPNNIMSMLNAGKNGFKKGIKFNIGIFIGFAIVMALCSVFSTVLLTYLPAIEPIMVYVSAAYMIWLAYKTYKSDYNDTKEEKQKIYGLKEGIILQFVNPKAIIYGITIASTFIVPYYHKPWQLLAFTGGLAFIAFVATCSWALFGSFFHQILKSKTKLLNTVMALVLVITAVSLFV